MQRDSIANTFVVAASLCLVCSLLVSTAAIQLKPRQDKNAEVYRKRNVLNVAGLDAAAIRDAGGAEKVFAERVTDIVVDLRSGEEAAAVLAAAMKAESPGNAGLSDAEAIARYNPLKAAKNSKNPKQSRELATAFASKKEDIAGIGAGRENFAHVYRYQASSEAAPIYIFPVRGLGLWSTLHGFLALESDGRTVAGITFFEHGETPGLGGEIENPSWKARWPGKKVYGEGTNVELRVIKGTAEPGDLHAIDGLAGATITSNGVSNIVEFWLGPSGFGPFITRLAETGTSPAEAAAETPATAN